MEQIEVPSHFLCPISLQLMRDPVTISTGITYDRESIETWLFACKNNICPVTKQVLSETDLTPNHTLRRLIQAWCTLNSSFGIERIPTPKPAVDRIQIVKILSDAKKSPHMQSKCLIRLRSIALHSERNRSVVESTGAVDFLATIVKSSDSTLVEVEYDGGSEITKASDEALGILSYLKISERNLKNLMNDEEFVYSLIQVLKHGNYPSRAYAIILLKSVFGVADPGNLISVKKDFFSEIVKVLRDKISQQASKSALKLLVELCPWGRNRIKAVESGAVLVLVEHLLDINEKRSCELVLHVLDQLCRCAEGRAEFLSHGAGLAIVSKKILRVSHMASDKAVRILSSVCRFSATARVLQEMLQVGVVSKLCLVLQVDTGLKTRERAKEILKLHSRVWRDSTCIPAHLLSSYPCS